MGFRRDGDVEVRLAGCDVEREEARAVIVVVEHGDFVAVERDALGRSIAFDGEHLAPHELSVGDERQHGQRMAAVLVAEDEVATIRLHDRGRLDVAILAEPE